jgi:Uma2 family endonuclease
MTGQTLTTADELLRLNLPNKRTELIRGHLVVREPAGGPHGEVSAGVGALIWAHARANKLGKVFAAETGFKIESNPDTVRAPDVAFVRAGRLPTPLERGYPKIAPDLAVEVLSPDDRPREVTEKVKQWIERGTLLVWVIDPETKTAQVYRADGREGFIQQNEWLDGEAVLPGFRCSLSEIFE